ncbi:heme exporter protein CcmD [Rhodobacterales bacterium]|nr:heme exporter protein CcmD [Rhodobacterales bacterium]
MDLGPHAGFIIASYVLCAITVLGLIAWVRLDQAAQERALKELADRGIGRARTGQDSKS